jgi:ABC-type multidrug transport system permease subunit
MTHRLILRLAAFVGIVFGIALMFVPDLLLAAYGADSLNNPGRGMAMLYGAVLTGFAIMNFAASQAPDIAEIHYVLIGNLAASTLAFVITLYRQLMVETVPDTAWFNVILHFGFAALFGYLYMASPAGYRLHAPGRHA